MSLVSEMLDAVKVAATGDADGFEPLPRCDHSRSGLDFYCFILNDPTIMCKHCFERSLPSTCAGCYALLDPSMRRVFCFLIRDHFGASPTHDIFVAAMCETCGVHAPEGERAPSSWVLDRQGRKIMLILRGRVVKTEPGEYPVLDLPGRDKQEKKLKGVLEKVQLKGAEETLSEAS